MKRPSNKMLNVIEKSILDSSYIQKQISLKTPFDKLKYVDVIVHHISETLDISKRLVLESFAEYYNGLISDDMQHINE